MALHPEWRTRRWSRPGSFRRAAICCAAVLLLAGCTADHQAEPTSSTASSGTAPPTPTQGSDGTGLIPPDTATGSVAPSAPGTGTSTPPSPPEVASLAWLSGADDSGGIVVDTEQGRRWQGPVAGEYALLDDAGYRWFGADGSMVGCAADAGCVAVDSAGTIAVATKRKGPRLVFSADGTFLGRFSATGDKTPAPKQTPTLTKTLAGSGVDLPGLVNAASRRPPFAGGATGDPHLITAGGVRFTTQQVGQFVARGGDPDHAIQLWLAPMAHRQDVSVVTEVAIGTGDAVITVDDTGTVTIDGIVRPMSSKFDQVTLSDGVAVGRWPTTGDRSVPVAVVWPDGGSVTITARPALGLTIAAHLASSPGVVGLFGSAGHPATSDLAPRSGSGTDVDRTVNSWAVTPTERLFGAAATPNPGFPAKMAAITPGAANVGQQACAGQGITNSDDLSACTFDVALTGDTGFVAGHVELAVTAESSSLASSFAARWPALLAGKLADAGAMPDDGRLSFTLAKDKSRIFRVGVDQSGPLRFVNRSGCGVDESPPGIDAPAMRLFDQTGAPVSDRFALCGHEQTPDLAPGTYYLVVANGPATDRYVRVDVTVP
jgi:hypothetical protein